ncbi:hypothetical protein KC333_g2458 [Hortaea werneckii]|nr:hypothetical protein KC333_g2458 [Hortaea werneckii]KAI7319930.1 hypothetical protein KC326_g2935 [Hortaea werneckii]
MEAPHSQHSPPLPVGPQQQETPLRKPQSPQEPGSPASSNHAARSRASSLQAASDAPPRSEPQPLKDAVNNAFDQSPVAQTGLDPELVRQVTEQVIKNLQTANINTPTASVAPGQAAHFPPPPPAPQASSPTPSQARSSIDSGAPRQYTPPSPEKRWVFGERERNAESGYGSSSPDPMQSDHESIYSSMYSKGSRRSDQSMGSQRDTPRPAPDGAGYGAGLDRGANTGPKRSPPVAFDGAVDERRKQESESDGTARGSGRRRRDSKGSESDYNDATSIHRQRRPPKMPTKTEEPEEATTLERIWQPLFDSGNPTMRLSQFLRGLALHLIEDCEPRYSLVVTPGKMARFFRDTKTADEYYPWDTIFGPRMSNASLGKVYQKLLCQHHLVQTQYHEIPSIPGLTPAGFEQLMTCLIQAHPDNEFNRLAKAVMDMPISNADNKRERFPKELSRRLLPREPNLMAEQRIIASLNHEPGLIPLRSSVAMPPPPPSSSVPPGQPPSQPPSQQSSFSERDRMPYSSTPFSNAVDDDDLGPTAVPLERERKPYVAREGTGKKYGNDDQQPRERETRPPPTSYRGEVPMPRRHSSSRNQVPTQGMYGSSPSEPLNIPPPKSHRHSVNQGPPPAMYNANMPGIGPQGSLPKGSGRRTPPPQPMNNGRRTPPLTSSIPKAGRRTPPPRNPFARSEPMGVDGIAPGYYASNLHGQGFGIDPRYGQPGPEVDEDPMGRTRYHNRRPTDRNGTGTSGDDEPGNGRGYPIPPRPPPSSQPGFDPSSYTASSQMGSSFPNRRSTWYGASNIGPSVSGPPGGSGSDGYGSFAAGNNYPYGSSGQQPY